MTKTHTLKQALTSDAFSEQFPLLRLVNHQLTGAIEISESTRKKLLRQMSIQTRSLIKSKKVTEVYSAEHKFKYRDATKVSPMTFTKNDLGYVQFECTEEEPSGVEEYLDTVFYLKYLDKIVGYFSINLEYSQLENTSYLFITMNEIFISFLHRDREYWLDLTAAVVDFLNGVIANIYQQLNLPTSFEVKLESNLSRTSGTLISHAVIKSLRKKLNYIHRTKHNPCVNECIVYSHFEIDDMYEMNVFR
jgi:hypothetical protein